MLLQRYVTPYNPVEIHCHFGGKYCFRLRGLKVNQNAGMKQQSNEFAVRFPSSSTLKMEAATSVNFSKTTWRHHPRVTAEGISDLTNAITL